MYTFKRSFKNTRPYQTLGNIFFLKLSKNTPIMKDSILGKSRGLGEIGVKNDETFYVQSDLMNFKCKSERSRRQKKRP